MSMKLTVIWALALSLLCSCHNGNAKQTTEVNENQKETNMETKDEKVLVAYFSRADENYNVGNITKGNTEIIAEMIAEQTGGELFHIERTTPYPKAYNPCIEEAQQELRSKARPAIKGDVQVEDFDVIFLGYPNWWGDVPMAVYTFIEKHSWQGKTVIPFCTHEGSGLGMTVRKLKGACEGATFADGLAIQGAKAQNSRAAAKKSVEGWLGNLGFRKG